MNFTGPARIGLGTVQFGLDYGITNAAGRVSEAEVTQIANLCRETNVNTIDTAHLYGCSEQVLGRTFGADGFRIITKTPKFGEARSAEEAVEGLRSAFRLSLRRLNVSRIHALLLHDPADLLGPLGAALWRAMEEVKEAGLVSRLGVSVYEGHEIDVGLERFPLEVVQLPFNALDRRLVNGGQMTRLAAAGVEIHARSVFLQGLLLKQPEAIPARFAPIRDAVFHMNASFRDAGLSQFEGVLALALQCREIDRFIVGVTSAAELLEVLAAAAKADSVPDLRFEPPPLDGCYLNPAEWHTLG